MRHPAFRFVVLALMMVAVPLYAGTATAGLPKAVDGQTLPTLAPMLKQVTPAVVNISTVGHVDVQLNPLFNDPFFRHFFDVPQSPRHRKTQSLGSGVIVDAEHGYVLTNHHVIHRADEITVTLRDGRQLEAKVVGLDKAADVAVIQIPAKDLTAIPLADSDQLEVGDFVVAIGNPFGLGQTVTSGIVSALGRSGLGIEGYEDFIQTDASINPGNSGGALVDLSGHLVGINTAIIAPGGGNVGIGFAIPGNMARDIMAQLVKHGEVRRGSLGIAVQELTPGLARAFNLDRNRGTVIAQVRKNSPADQAGLRAGDIIVRINGRPVRNTHDFRNRLGMMTVDQTVELTVLRNGDQISLTPKLAERTLKRLEGSKLHRRLAGIMLETRLDTEGIIATSVKRDSPAWQLGLRPGDIIRSANQKNVASLQALRDAAKGSDQLLLNIQRGNAAMFLVVR